jgi:hypothetical protein
MESNLSKLLRMEKIDSLNIRDIEQIESLMVELSKIQRECSDTIKSIYDESLMMQKVFVLNGGFGWKVEIQKVYLKQQNKVSKAKK